METQGNGVVGSSTEVRSHGEGVTMVIGSSACTRERLIGQGQRPGRLSHTCPERRPGLTWGWRDKVWYRPTMREDLVKLDRCQRLVEHMRAQNLDAVALVPGPNLVYLTGLSFHLSERPIVTLFPADGRPAIILPQLEAVRVVGEEMDLFAYSDEEGPRTAFRNAFDALDLRGARIGAESLRMRLMEVQLLDQHADGSELVSAGDVLVELRLRKDGNELDHMRSAAAITDEALATTMGRVKGAMSEREIASLLQIELLRAGADGMAFSPIVLTGPNSALPHNTPSDRRIRLGDPFIVDCGASVEGYAADLTRTFFVEEPSAEWSRIYEVVRAANAAGRAAVRSGVTAESIDRAARDVIDRAGYGEYFIHRTGHGLGLETHEPPYMIAGNRRLLEPGMVFTVEPGIYLPGQGGVRIEDDILVTAEGPEVLTNSSRDLTTIRL